MNNDEVKKKPKERVAGRCGEKEFAKPKKTGN
jgi:hypothetical protein